MIILSGIWYWCLELDLQFMINKKHWSWHSNICWTTDHIVQTNNLRLLPQPGSPQPTQTLRISLSIYSWNNIQSCTTSINCNTLGFFGLFKSLDTGKGMGIAVTDVQLESHNIWVPCSHTGGWGWHNFLPAENLGQPRSDSCLQVSLPPRNVFPTAVIALLFMRRGYLPFRSWASEELPEGQALWTVPELRGSREVRSSPFCLLCVP